MGNLYHYRDYFSFHYSDKYKAGREILHLLLDIVCKGGNLALNVAPQTDVELSKPAVKSMKELDFWLSAFGHGIFETKIQVLYIFDNNH